MLLLKLLFSRKFRNLRKLLFEVKMFWPPSQGDKFLMELRFFSYLFYTHGFLGVNQTPAFPNAYKNISPDVFRKTYVALPLYYAFRHGIKDSNFTSVEELVAVLSQKCPTLDINVLKRLSSEWKESSHDDLDQKLYQHFKRYAIFNKVFAVDEAEVWKWFKNFLNQPYNYSVQHFLS